MFSENHLLISKINRFVTEGIDFAIYRSPESDTVHLLKLRLSDGEAISLNQDLWVVRPFSVEESPVYYDIISEESFEIISKLKQDKLKVLSIPSDVIERYRSKVENAIFQINKETLNKVVLHTQIEVTYSSTLQALIDKVLSYEAEGFHYAFYSSDFGLWMGITPEVLVSSNERFFETMALAGTRRFEDLSANPFREKERAEQRWVTKEIVELLDKSVNTINVGEVETIKAGRLAHLRTIINGEIKPSISTADIANILHPTAAVCGYPKNLAYQFIQENESLERSLYSGYLGRIKKQSSSLYVNLRCMSYKEGVIRVYVGAGITADSDPQLESEEILIKTSTLASILMA